MENGTRRPKYWTQVEGQLSDLGYTLKKKLSNNDSKTKSSPSEVWFAEHKTSDGGLEEVALKLSSQVFSILSGSDADDLKKLDEHTQREVKILEKAGSHPNIPDFVGYHRLSYGDIAAIDALAMQYVPMPNLLDGMKKRGEFREIQATRLLEDILSALDHVHTGLDEPVLHRDIKPSNILFDGIKAFLFDFNFSKIGETTSSSTFVDNHGYYPADAYSGRQTPSQDLVALGNTVIAAALGKEIGDIRYEQGKGGLESVDINIAAFSPKMQRFLRKLTAENPAFRYQSAAQALQDLKNLEQLTEEQLEKKASTIVRNKGLEKLLSALKERDRFFEHNVPPAIRTRYDDDRLLEYLESTYTQETFVIETPEEISKYATSGDRVVKVGDHFEQKAILVKPGDKGKIKKDDNNGKAVVKFKDIELELPYDTFILVGYTGFFGYLDHGNPRTGKRLATKGRKGFEIEYTGKPILNEQRPLQRIPDDSEGIILSRRTDQSYEILWANRPGLNQVMEEGRSQNWQAYHKPHWSYFSGNFKLVVPNTINYRELYAQCFSEEQKQLPKPAETVGNRE